MKKVFLAASIFLSGFSTCLADGPSVMARFVPERKDDFVFENDLIAGRIYGEALEHCGKGEIVSPGVDVWVKTPGELVADKRYEDGLQHGKSYHKDWGNGKDCYKVGRSLGAGASSPIVNGKLCFPQTNFREWEIIENGNNRTVFSLSYPQWEIEGGIKVALKKIFTVEKGSYFVNCKDFYTFTGIDSLTIAAGVNRHKKQKDCLVSEEILEDRYILWEHASDQSAEPEDGLLGIAVVMPGADSTCLTADSTHGVCCRTIRSNEAVEYYFGSCWSKCLIKDFDSWKKEVTKIAMKQ